jgi:hypothetical protein
VRHDQQMRTVKRKETKRLLQSNLLLSLGKYFTQPKPGNAKVRLGLKSA